MNDVQAECVERLVDMFGAVRVREHGDNTVSVMAVMSTKDPDDYVPVAAFHIGEDGSQQWDPARIDCELRARAERRLATLVK